MVIGAHEIATAPPGEAGARIVRRRPEDARPQHLDPPRAARSRRADCRARAAARASRRWRGPGRPRGESRRPPRPGSRAAGPAAGDGRAARDLSPDAVAPSGSALRSPATTTGASGAGRPPAPHRPPASPRRRGSRDQPDLVGIAPAVAVLRPVEDRRSRMRGQQPEEGRSAAGSPPRDGSWRRGAAAATHHRGGRACRRGSTAAARPASPPSAGRRSCAQARAASATAPPSRTAPGSGHSPRRRAGPQPRRRGRDRGPEKARVLRRLQAWG